MKTRSVWRLWTFLKSACVAGPACDPNKGTGAGEAPNLPSVCEGQFVCCSDKHWMNYWNTAWSCLWEHFGNWGLEENEGHDFKKELGKAEMMIEEKHWNKTKRIQKCIYVEKSLWQTQRFWTYFKNWGNLSLILTSVISYMLNLYETICCVELWSN